MGLWIAKAIVEEQLAERAQAHIAWPCCPNCGRRLMSKGFVKRRMLTLVGEVEWKRRVGRCPRHCPGSHSTPFDNVLGIKAYQQTSTELLRLDCLLAVFLPFELAAMMLQELTGICVSHATIWNWAQAAAQQAKTQLETQLQDFNDGKHIQSETLEPMLMKMPLIIAADGVTVSFRSQPKTPKGGIIWRGVKVALLARFGKRQTQTGRTVRCLHQ
jgi:hypothetical protein